MNFIQPYSALDAGNFDLKTAKKQFPTRNLHYASTLAPLQTRFSQTLRHLPVPQASSSRTSVKLQTRPNPRSVFSSTAKALVAGRTV